MKQRLIGILSLCILLFCLAAPTALAAEPETAEASPTGQIYLCGETHASEDHIQRELSLWNDLYQQGVRHLFVELPSYAASYLNLWMKADDDSILDRLYQDWSGTAMDSPVTRTFYQTIKEQYPETVFHGFDVGHQYNTTGNRYRLRLILSGQLGSADWAQTQDTIRQGKTYYQTQDNTFRENQMAANLISAFEALPDGTSIMVITGSDHSNLYGMDVIGTVPCLANQLRQAYGSALTAWNYSAALDYSRAGQTASIRINGQLYSAVCLADQDLSALLPGYRSRTFWLVSDAYEAVKNLPLTGDVLPYSNYPCSVQPGQVFVLDYALSDGSALRLFYRADGTSYQGAPTTVGFDAG